MTESGSRADNGFSWMWYSKDVSAFENLCNTYFIKKDYDRAVAYIDQAVRLAPNDAAALYGRSSRATLQAAMPTSAPRRK
jgi:tetratricopeptide (TPR) repeat protein